MSIERLSKLQDVYAFAKPLLQQALNERFGVEDDVEETSRCGCMHRQKRHGGCTIFLAVPPAALSRCWMPPCTIFPAMTFTQDSNSSPA